MMEDPDYWTIAAMIKYGGGFVVQLGILFRTADDSNKRILKETFPEYWKKYSAMGQKLQEENNE
ncbi:MAG: hypothetical protein KAS32_13705 [Candidatus Peribacteraceae bacterium]|nr:hypothetical protein [Candidatus Peribacteraceae bacterium]